MPLSVHVSACGSAFGPEGSPGPDALPDFLVLIEPSHGETFRTVENTFDAPN